MTASALQKRADIRESVAKAPDAKVLQTGFGASEEKVSLPACTKKSC